MQIHALAEDTLTLSAIGSDGSLYPAEDLFPAEDLYPQFGGAVATLASDALTLSAITPD